MTKLFVNKWYCYTRNIDKNDKILSVNRCYLRIIKDYFNANVHVNYKITQLYAKR